jgi:hypothetical protein
MGALERRGVGGAWSRRRAYPTLEAADVTVLYYDEEYDRIDAITGQPTRWLAPKGTLR